MKRPDLPLKSNIRLLLSSVLLVIACQHINPTPQLIVDYSYDSSWAYTFSVKIYSDGKAYLKKNDMQSDTLFARSDLNIDTVKAALAQLRDSKIAHTFLQRSIADAAYFNLILYNNGQKQEAYFYYGDRRPEILTRIENYMNNLPDIKGWAKLRDTTINFASTIEFPKFDIKQVHFPPPVKK